MTVAQELFNRTGRRVAAADPDDFGRRAKEEAALMEVRIFGHDGESVLGGIVPHGFIRHCAEPHVAHVAGLRILPLQRLYQPMGQILIEE